MSNATASSASAETSTQPASPLPPQVGKDSAPAPSTAEKLTGKAPAPVSKAESEAAKRLFKVKIDKDEVEVDEAELVRGYQLRKASDKRFQEASQKAKEIEEIISILRNDPKRALTHPEIGVDVRKFAEQVLAEQLEEELMDPKDKEMRALKKQYEEAQSKLKEREEADRKAQEEVAIKGYTEQYTKEITEAINSSGLPLNANVTNRVRDYMLMALNNGYEVSALEVMPYVKDEYIKDIKSIFSSGDAQVIADLLGEEGMKKVRSFDLSRLKDPKGSTPKDQPPEKPSQARKKFKTTDSYFEDLRKKFED